MTILEDGKVELVETNGNRVTLTPSKKLHVIETDEPNVVRIEKDRGWSHMVRGDYAEIRDTLAGKEAA